MTHQTLSAFAAAWKDTPEFHLATGAAFQQAVNEDAELKSHRDYIEANAYGFGDRAFHWLWLLIVQELPEDFWFLEIGVHRGQVLSLVALLSERFKKDGNVYGLSPFDGRDVGDRRDYRDDVLDLFRHFKLPLPWLIQGQSNDPEAIYDARKMAPWCVVYVDGAHDEATVTHDILTYAPMVRPGGFLVMDDSANRLSVPVECWPGIQSVSDAVDKLLPPFGPAELPDGSGWEHLGNMVHNRIWRRAK